MGSVSRHQLFLFLLKELDDKFLVLLDEVVGQALVSQVLSKILPPLRVECVENGEFRLVTVGASNGWHSAMRHV